MFIHTNLLASFARRKKIVCGQLIDFCVLAKLARNISEIATMYEVGSRQIIEQITSEMFALSGTRAVDQKNPRTLKMTTTKNSQNIPHSKQHYPISECQTFDSITMTLEQ